MNIVWNTGIGLWDLVKLSILDHFTATYYETMSVYHNQVGFLWGGHHQDFTNSVSAPSHKCMWYSLPLFEALLSWTERVLAISLQFGKSTTCGSTCESLYKLSMQNWQEVMLNLPNGAHKSAWWRHFDVIMRSWAQQAMPMPDWYQQPHGHFPPSTYSSHSLPPLFHSPTFLLASVFLILTSKQKQWKQI